MSCSRSRYHPVVPAHDDPPVTWPRDTAGEVTLALQAWRDGAPGALDRLVPLLYQDLRRLARQRLRSERDAHTLGTTALAHEAYIRLSSQRHLQPADRDAFFAAVSNTMRRVLVDHARARRRVKRGDGVSPVPLDEVEPLLPEHAIDETLALDAALTRLAATFPRAATIFEQRLFGGLTNDEVAQAIGVSPKTAQRDWEAARAWLRKEIGRGVPTP
ncbi:MAG: sigma-70 family RNA polymerase sigma factor [Acidobacteria bacterium]|nr:sigma-70 family RNA polymerase sigma factor [Acidobacteriota bacterium]